MFDGTFYDADYFERGKASGKGWLEYYRWMPRRSIKEAFGFIDYLDITPGQKVLDVGCAKGHLVRAFRTLDIEAYGCDISGYALMYAPYGCWDCSEHDSWDEHGRDFIITIKDVLEHCSEFALFRMLENMARLSNKIMCVIPMGDKGVYRIPEYHKEISHLIVENEQWWEEQFEAKGWHLKKSCSHVPGIKDNWKQYENGNHVYVFER